MFSRTGYIALEEELSSLLSEKRFLHSKATALTCVSLAQHYCESIDLGLCYQAGLVHDIVRQWDAEALASYAQRWHLDLEEEEREDPVLLHGPVGAHLLRQKGYPEELCLAVRYHTLGSIGMGRLGLVLFIADFIEPGRTHLSEAVRTGLLSLPSLDLLCLQILEMQEAYLASNGKVSARCSKELAHYLLSGKIL